jgi:hypothetical protein
VKLPSFYALVLAFSLTGSADPVFAAVNLHEAGVAVAQHDLKHAAQVLRGMIGAQPDDAAAHYYLAQVLDQEGLHTDALSELARSRELDTTLSFTTPQRFNAILRQVLAHGGPADKAAVALQGVPSTPGVAAAAGASGHASTDFPWTLLICAGPALAVLAGSVFMLLAGARRNPEETERRRQLARVRRLLRKAGETSLYAAMPEESAIVQGRLRKAETALHNRAMGELVLSRLEQDVEALLGQTDRDWPSVPREKTTPQR